jgi:RNA polymerase sigma-70 factor (ECF subfamily)
MVTDDQHLSDATRGSGRFHSTAWSMVIDAQHGTEATSRRSMERLVQRYWRPVFGFVRRWVGDHENAKDTTQGFFAAFLEKGAIAYADRDRGKFRNFLIASVKRYMQQQHRAASHKPKQLPITDLDQSAASFAFFEGESEDPQSLFMKNWAKCLVETCLTRLRNECEELGKGTHFEVFRRRFLSDDPAERSYRSIAAALDITEKAVGNYFERTKARFARVLRSEIENSMLPGQGVDDEVREILSLLSS